MRCPTLKDLPPPLKGKSGWPWTEETRPPVAVGSDDIRLPRVTVVTPSYNQGGFIEETIRSVLLQGYPNLEYIVIDGGSTDQSVEIIRKYEKWLAHWVSEKDEGQTHAINKGFTHSAGEICAYLNSDDVYLPNALRDVAAFFHKNSDTGMAYGDCQIIDESSRINDSWIAPEFNLLELVFRCYIAQPAAFWRNSTAASVGNFNTEMHYAFDYQMWLRVAAARFKLSHVPLMLAQHRKTEGTKTVSQPEEFTAEIVGGLKTFFGSPSLPAALKSIESDAYAIVFLNHSLLNFRRQSIEEARRALEFAFSHSPDLVARQRERVIRAIVANADPSGPIDDAREYMERLFAQLPDSARGLEQIRARVLRRVEILHASRSQDLQSVRRAWKLLLPILIDDAMWLRNDAARSEILKLLIGQSGIRRLAGFKRLLAEARGSIPRDEENLRLSR